MRSVKTTDLKEGDILAQNVINRRGVLIAGKNTVLNNYIIGRLNDLELKRISICCPQMPTGQNDEESGYLQLKENYEKSVLEIKAIINEIAAGKPLDLRKVDNIIRVAEAENNNAGNIIKVLNDEKGFDEYTYTHSLNVAFYSMLIGRWLNLSRQNIVVSAQAGLLHDIGKIKIPKDILNKKTGLSKEEFELIKKHPHYGYEMAESTGFFSGEVCEAILSHHERIDGSGYPNGYNDEETGIHAKIVAIADVFDAMTTDRPYKKRSTPFEVFGMFKTTGVKNFDPIIINIFIASLSVYYVGSKVLLNTGEVGEIAYIPPQSITEPVIRLDDGFIDLARETGRRIIRMI